MEKIDCILLVDDDQTTNFMNELLITEMGIARQVLTALNGQEALELIRRRCEASQGCPSIILLDINMPVMNGFEFVETYKQLDLLQQQSAIIVVLTTSLNPKDIERVKRLKVNRYLNKPLSEDALKDLVKEYFSLNQ